MLDLLSNSNGAVQTNPAKLLSSAGRVTGGFSLLLQTFTASRSDVGPTPTVFGAAALALPQNLNGPLVNSGAPTQTEPEAPGMDKPEKAEGLVAAETGPLTATVAQPIATLLVEETSLPATVTGKVPVPLSGDAAQAQPASTGLVERQPNTTPNGQSVQATPATASLLTVAASNLSSSPAVPSAAQGAPNPQGVPAPASALPQQSELPDNILPIAQQANPNAAEVLLSRPEVVSTPTASRPISAMEKPLAVDQQQISALAAKPGPAAQMSAPLASSQGEPNPQFLPAPASALPQQSEILDNNFLIARQPNPNPAEVLPSRPESGSILTASRPSMAVENAPALDQQQISTLTAKPGPAIQMSAPVASSQGAMPTGTKPTQQQSPLPVEMAQIPAIKVPAQAALPLKNTGPTKTILSQPAPNLAELSQQARSPSTDPVSPPAPVPTTTHEQFDTPKVTGLGAGTQAFDNGPVDGDLVSLNGLAPQQAERSGALPQHQFNDAGAQKASAKPVADALMAQVKMVDVQEGRTTVQLQPRGLGAIEVEMFAKDDVASKVVVRVENPLVLQTLREERHMLAQAIGVADSSVMSFEDKAKGGETFAGQEGDHDAQSALISDSTEVQTAQHQDIVDDGTLDVMA